MYDIANFILGNNKPLTFDCKANKYSLPEEGFAQKDIEAAEDTGNNSTIHTKQIDNNKKTVVDNSMLYDSL